MMFDTGSTQGNEATNILKDRTGTEFDTKEWFEHGRRRHDEAEG